MFKDRDGWRVQWTENGKRHSRKFDSKGAAKVFEAQLRHGLLPQAGASTMTFTAFADEWLKRYCEAQKDLSQHVTDESTIRVHLKPQLGELRLIELQKPKLLSWRDSLQHWVAKKTGQPIKPKTRNNAIGLLKKMLQTAVEWDYLPANPAASLKAYPVDEVEIDYWTGEERDRFWRFARQESPEFAKICIFAALTGLRRGEIAGLQRHQLNFDARTILVNAKYCFKKNQRRLRPKGKTWETVPMNSEVAKLLEDRKLLLPEAPVFEKELLRHAAVTLRRLCEKIGARPIRFHGLRHTFGSSLAMAGVDSYTRQRLMRHKTPAMTQRYSHLAPSHLAEAAEVVVTGARKPARGDSKSELSSGEHY